MDMGELADFLHSVLNSPSAAYYPRHIREQIAGLIRDLNIEDFEDFLDWNAFLDSLEEKEKKNG